MTTHIYTEDQRRDDIPWRVTKIQIASTLEVIPEKEFNKLQFLEEIDFDEGSQLKLICDSAFEGCANLQAVDLRKSPLLETLGESTFQDCTPALSTVWLAPKIRYLSSRSFSRCYGLTEVHLNEDLAEIWTEAFEFCRKLQIIDFSKTNKLTMIGLRAFYMNESLVTLILPDSVGMIKRQAFKHCRGLQKLTLGAELVQLSDQVFAECTNLDVLDMSASKRLRVISQECFLKCSSLRRIMFSPGTKTIREGAFARCPTFMKLELPPKLEVVDSRAFERCTALIAVDFPSTTRTIGDRAFNLCTSLTTVLFPDGLESIGREAFAFCNLLETAKLPSSMDKTKIGLNAFYGCPLMEDVPNQGLWVYNGVDPIPTFVEHVRLSENVTTISSEPFDLSALCTEASLTSIQFNDGLQEISAGAFSYCNCPELTTVSIPSSVVRLADPFDETFVSDIEIMRGKTNIALAIRLKLLYPNSTPTLTMDRLVYLYSFDPIHSNDLLKLPTDWSSVRSRLNRKRRGSYSREKELLQSQFYRERELLKEIQVAYPQTIHNLVVWCLERGKLDNIHTVLLGLSE
ncbi:unnamed protein product [Cylindrotheca closterium]|uniref:Leucine-rich repeat domain-containing protein n=1 Tax=Cylindrotheca closterium TaxID=2856 RepID=A0AAD2G647_9STRA|nr:unnamed protein product [Cylindrotheca closterium]